VSTIAPPGTQTTFYLARGGQDFGPYSLHDLQAMASRRHLRPSDLVRQGAGGRALEARAVPDVFSSKSWPAALVLSLVLGTFGVDRFYLGHVWLGLAKLVTFGGLGIWWLVDLILIAFRQVNDAGGRPLW
jgi:hypothetical protein